LHSATKPLSFGKTFLLPFQFFFYSLLTSAITIASRRIGICPLPSCIEERECHQKFKERQTQLRFKPNHLSPCDPLSFVAASISAAATIIMPYHHMVQA